MLNFLLKVIENALNEETGENEIKKAIFEEKLPKLERVAVSLLAIALLSKSFSKRADLALKIEKLLAFLISKISPNEPGFTPLF